MIASPCALRAGDHGTTGQTEVKWGGGASHDLGRRDTEAGGLLSAQSRSSPQGRGSVTTRAMKAKLLGDAGHYDRLAAKADRAAEVAAGL